MLLDSGDIIELYYINKFLHKDADLVSNGRVSMLSDNSIFFNRCLEVLSNKVITKHKKQLLLERFILEFEKNYIDNVISTIEDFENYKLISRVYKHSDKVFINRIKI